MTFEIDIPAGTNSKFYAHVDTDGAPRPALIVCPEVFGVNPHMRNVAARLAAAGYMAVVPDLYWRVEPRLEIPYDEAGLRRGSEILSAIDADLGAQDLIRVIEAVRAHPGCNDKVGVLGFCIGGTLAYLAAVRARVDAAVGYYAKGVERFLDEAPALSCPLMLHYAGADRFIPPSTVHAVRDALACDPKVEVFDYPGVDHGFNSDDRRAYDPEIARLAMSRTLALFARTLSAGARTAGGAPRAV